MSISLTYSIADQSLDASKSVGILNVSLNLLRHLARMPEIASLLVLDNSTFTPGWGSGDKSVSWKHHDEVLRSPLRRLAWDQWRLYRVSRESGNRWLFLPKGFASFMRKPDSLLACVFYDGMHDYYREHYRRGFPRFEMFYFLESLKATIRHADVIFTISDFTRSEVLRLARKYRLIPPPVITMGIGFADDDLLVAQLSQRASREDSIVVLASRWPHKRTDLALAHMRSWQARTGFTGRVHWVGTLPAGVSLPRLANWSLHCRLSFEEYGRLISRARALVYFSEYEGFGMPPVEALLAGAAPVFSDIPATREVMAGTGFPFANTDAGSFGVALDRALEAPAAMLSSWLAGLRQSHSWAKVCSQVIAGLTAVQSAKRGP